MGRCSVKEAFIRVENSEVYIYQMHISPYEKGNIFNKDPLRVRKLLLHKNEINKLMGQVAQKGFTIVPLKVYFKGSLVKVEIGLARGKSCMISGRILLKRISAVRRRENLRLKIFIEIYAGGA